MSKRGRTDSHTPPLLLPARAPTTGAPWPGAVLTDESEKQCTKLFELIDTDGGKARSVRTRAARPCTRRARRARCVRAAPGPHTDGRLTELDLPDHWDAVVSALGPEPGEGVGLDLPTFVMRMQRYTLSRPHEKKLWDWREEDSHGAGGCVVSYGECIERLGVALNRTLQNICK